MAKTQDKQTINQRREDNAMGKTQDKQTVNQRREDSTIFEFCVHLRKKNEHQFYI